MAIINEMYNFYRFLIYPLKTELAHFGKRWEVYFFIKKIKITPDYVLWLFYCIDEFNTTKSYHKPWVNFISESL